VHVIAHAPATAVRTQLDRWATIEDIDDHQCRVQMATDTLDWPTMALGAIGADFDIISPLEPAHYIDEWSHRFARAAAPHRHATSGSRTTDQIP